MEDVVQPTGELSKRDLEETQIVDQHRRCIEHWNTFLGALPTEKVVLPSFPIWADEIDATYAYKDMTPWAYMLGTGNGVASKNGSAVTLDSLQALPSYAQRRVGRFPQWKVRFITANRTWLSSIRNELPSGWVLGLRSFPPSFRKLEWNCQGEVRNLWGHVLQFRPSGLRVKRYTSSPSLVAMTSTQIPILGPEHRHLSRIEGLRLQGFPDAFRVPSSRTATFRALGNAVHVGVVYEIAARLLCNGDSVLESSDGSVDTHTSEELQAGVRSSSTSDVESIDIRPEVSVLGVFRYLNYQPWFAAAEFVDNAIQSFQDHRQELARLEGHIGKLVVKVKIDTSDDGFIQVSDNAAGIYRDEWSRALRPAEPPPDRSGLAEFGMGMKTAAAWFGRRLTVRSKALGEPFRRQITLDFNEIIERRIEKVRPETIPAEPQEHGTEVIVSGLHRPPQGRTIGKIRDHLASIYRLFLRDGSLQLMFQHGTNPEQQLEVEDVDILKGPRFDDPEGDHRLWSKPIDFDLGGGLHAHGFMAIRAVGSTANAGLALFRRKRLIEGSGDETYRPRAIFGASNSYEYQRLFGELTLEGFDISHTKGRVSLGGA